MVEISKKCPHCDTALEFTTEDGMRVAFTAHDDAFCFLATRERVRMLEQVILAQREAYERRIEALHSRIDAAFKKHGLPTLAEQMEQAAQRAAILHALDLPRVPIAWDDFNKE